MRDATPVGMKLVIAAIGVGSMLVIGGAACGRRAEQVGQTQTTSATVVPTETERTTPAVEPSPAAPVAAPPPVAPPAPSLAAPEPTFAVPGIVDDRGAPPGHERGTLSVIHAGDVSDNLDVGPAPSSSAPSPPPAPTASSSEPLVPNASSPIPWSGTR